jgi:O-antigen ligase
MQTLLPSLLPPVLVDVGDPKSLVTEGSRIRGTFAHPNTFAVYLLLFISLSWWKLAYSGRRWPWFILLLLLVFFLSTTKTMIALPMLATFILVVIAPRLSILNLIGGILLFTSVIVLFTNTEFGRERLGTIANTPLLNPDMDVSRAILLSKFDNNSFNWRIAQWDYLLRAWKQSPIFGFGLGTSVFISANGIVPHNDYVRALVEGGIVGLVTFLGFLGAQVVRLVQLLRATRRGSAQHELCLILLAVLLATLVGMLTENVWISTAFYFYWWTAFAVSGWNWNEVPTSQNSMPVDTLLGR